MDYDAYDALLHHIFKQTQADAWFKPSEENVHAGVCLRVDNGHFRVFPYENRYLEPFEAAVRALNPVVAVKVRSASVHAALAMVKDDADAIYVDDDTRIQVLDSMSWLPRADKEQCGAFIRDERVLVVWAYNLDDVIPTCRDFEDKLIKLVWSRRATLVPTSTSTPAIAPSLSALSSLTNSKEDVSDDVNEKPSEGTSTANLAGGTGATPAAPKAGIDEKTLEAIVSRKQASSKRNRKDRTCKLGFGYFVSNKPSVSPSSSSAEKKAGGSGGEEGGVGSGGKSKRPMRMLAPIYCGLAAGLSFYFIGSGISVMVVESVLDGNLMRFWLAITTPFLFCISLFFCSQLIGNITMIIGPVAQFHQNSKYYSAVPPAPNRLVDVNLPHITVEMPVYKESLKETIAPSVYSLKKAMQTYSRQGRTSSIFINDDGLQLISEQDCLDRIAFYSDNNISNMYYGLALSLKLEKHLAALLDIASADDADDDDELEERVLELAIEETYEESGRRFRPWASNAKSIRIGSIILIVDSDTVVPEDCFRDAARELEECPEVGIIQHESDVMQVANHYFENGIAHFTRRINKSISLGCSNGEVAPFVGHNAFLRWSALQDASFVDGDGDGDGGKRKIWSETNVSEDFDMALRLQLKGYIIRWATYSEGGFKEGVSLTCDDELNRWQKYAYGCNELIFNPIIEWWRKGPINKQLHTFLWSAAPVHYKVSMTSYMFSYYGIAAGFALSLMNYLLLGWSAEVDGYYLHSFEVWLACMAVFPVLGNLGFTLLEYRLGQRSLWDSLVENLTWVPFFFFFFGGLSIHLSQALLAHLFSYNITWGATKKEVERSNFWLEVPKIVKRFWIALVSCVVVSAGMVVLATEVVPIGWRIPGTNWAVIFPLAITVGSHVLYPIVLNPWLMIFSY
ncbi:glycosyl transferase family group 2-domain-containing protein [Irpex rosettiformis]|uniref:Glycosyl transferase family group 2-domain-containing protein n=1 Tax=Irpex rosettiformis TaxID=378272 RepID=A0ACB8TXY8_9APHY|nr:glycosyl transferase family group 2-domain-containing protein [Irpex rosettiformis]